MENKGVKHSEGKLPIFKVLFKQFPRAVQEIVRCSQAGNIKYGEADKNWDNWKHVKGGRDTYLDAAMRHLMEAEDFVWNDDMAPYGSGCRHMAQVCWNLICALELDLIEEEKPQTSVKWVEMDITKPETSPYYKEEGMDKPYEIKETSKLVPQEGVYVNLIPEQKEKMEEVRRLALEGKLTTRTNSGPKEDPLHKSWYTEADAIAKRAAENNTTWYEEFERQMKEAMATQPYPWYAPGYNPYPRLKPDQLIDKEDVSSIKKESEK